jgi:hypothetical protein
VTTNNKIHYAEIVTQFPPNENTEELSNPAIRLYGRRFYADQTPTEYLSEFLLVFSSPKNKQNEGAYNISIYEESDQEKSFFYYSKNHAALKLFTFFPYSKLETRHRVHRQTYLDILKEIEKCVVSDIKQDKEEIIQLIQSLLNGFVGVSKNRTWVTYTFLPISSKLLAHEVTWEHPKALKKKDEVIDWMSSKNFFDENTRNFLGRGGELLFLQLANLFSEHEHPEIKSMMNRDEYKHISKTNLGELKKGLESNLKNLLEESVAPINQLIDLIEEKLDSYQLNENRKPLKLGWVPKETRIEALLFAVEMDNLCSSHLYALEKLELLQILVCMHVLRSLCFQARRIDEKTEKTLGFIGNYAWITCDPNSANNEPTRKIAQNSFTQIDAMLYRVLRSEIIYKKEDDPAGKDLKNGDHNGYKHFRKFSKAIGLVIPIKGQGQRFTLNQNLLRFLVAALIKPGERVRLTVFYQRVFAHYGIALGGQELTTALTWIGHASGGTSYAVSSSTAWIEEALQQGGFLVELSDAVSMVHNPA